VQVENDDVSENCGNLVQIGITLGNTDCLMMVVVSMSLGSLFDVSPV
jgi:hypothetical protein